MLHNGRLIPSVLILSHAEQRQRLARSCPEALPVALVAGDPCFDRIALSAPLRESYRHAFGLAEHQRLVVVSSTWGEKSLFGSRPDLPMQLAEQLPLDEFRIAVVLHPNIWFGHSPGQLRAWLADWARAGIVIVPPEEGWRAALIASDLVIGDYGSVTFYAAAQGAPLLLASHPTDLLDPNSPIVALLAAAPQVDPKRHLLDQVRDTIAQHAPEQYAHITAQTTSAPGRSHALLRTAIYRELRLSEPDTPASTSAVPLPTVSAQAVDAQLIGVRPSEAGIELTRFPAEVLYRAPEVARGRFLVVGTNQPRQSWLERADALVRSDAGPVRRWIDGTLAALPGCLVAAARDETAQWVVADRAGRLFRFVRVGGGELSADDGACCAALVCAELTGVERLARAGLAGTEPMARTELAEMERVRRADAGLAEAERLALTRAGLARAEPMARADAGLAEAERLALTRAGLAGTEPVARADAGSAEAERAAPASAGLAGTEPVTPARAGLARAGRVTLLRNGSPLAVRVFTEAAALPVD
ncbi:MAG TPA: hypothetical protein VGN81_01975 [Pseudonocardiaceae bacterium]